MEYSNELEDKCFWDVVLQEDIENKVYWQGDQCGGSKSNADGIKVFKEYEEEKMDYAWHVMRGSSGLSLLQILEGRVERKRKVGRSKKTWTDDIFKWTGLENYEEKKGAAEQRKRWKLMVVNLH